MSSTEITFDWLGKERGKKTRQKENDLSFGFDLRYKVWPKFYPEFEHGALNRRSEKLVLISTKT